MARAINPIGGSAAMKSLRACTTAVATILIVAVATPVSHAQSGPPPQPLPGDHGTQEPIFPPGPWRTCLVGCPRDPVAPWTEETTYFCVNACDALAMVGYDCGVLDLEQWLVQHGWMACPEGSLRGCCHPGELCAAQLLPDCCLDEYCQYLRAKCRCERLAEINPSPPAANSCDLTGDGLVDCADLDELLGALHVTENCPESAGWVLDAACCFLSKVQSECGASWTPGTGGSTACTDIRECVEARVGRPLRAAELQGLMACYVSDVADCGCCRKAPGGTEYYSCETALVCDRDGDNQVDCTDLKQLLEDSKAICHAGEDLKDEKKLDIACAFIGACAPLTKSECQAFLATMLDCLEDELCRTLTKDEVEALAECTENCKPEDCCSEAGGWSCGETFRCDRANCDGVIDCADIGAFVAESEAGCNGGDPYSRAERVALICDFFEKCGEAAGSDICADLKECLEGILGGELKPEEKATLAECTGCGDICPPDDGEEQDKPDEGDDGCAGQGARGSGPGGTDAAYGDVIRSETDLVVPAAGPALTLGRAYTSDPTFESGCSNPEGWSNSAFLHVDDSESGSLKIMGNALGAITVATSGGGPWPLPGPTSRVLSQTTTTVGGGSISVWRVTDPGRTMTDYYRTSGSGDPELAALNGLLLETQDPNGNRHSYDYAFYGLDSPSPRLRRIFVNGSASALAAGTPPDALVEFDWIVAGADLGRIGGTSVFRFNGTLDLPRFGVHQIWGGPDRRYSTVNPLAPHGWTEYDNLDRVVKEALFTAEPTAIDAPLNSGADSRGRYSETSYSQRGLVYRQAVATNPRSASPTFLESHTWFDQTGRPVGTWGPNGPGQKTTYDGLGRATVAYSTDRRGDPMPGASGNFSAVFNLATHESNVADDVVLEQAHTRYITDRGLVDLVTRRQRTHDAGASDVGALDSGGYPSNKSITTFSGAWYDAANRPIRDAQFGTNAAGFASGGSAPAIVPSAPPSSNAADATRLVTETRYDPRGLIESMTDPMGRITRFHYDALGRRIMVIENFDAENPLVFHWETASAPPGEYLNSQQWVVADGIDFDEPDRNRSTSFVHDGLGNTVRQTAYLVERDTSDPGPPPMFIDRIVMQETAYLYGVSATAGSSITSYDLLGMVFYPDSDRATTHAGTIDEPQPVRFAYNCQAEIVTMRDANETGHAYTRDALGRVTIDKATVSTAMPGFQVDGTVNAIASEFDTLGRLRSNRSYADHGGVAEAIVNAVQLGYDDLGQVTSVTQQPDGDISGGSASAALAYDIQPVASGNRSRRVELTYPDGWEFGTTYGSAGSLDDRISRTRDIRDAATGAVYAQYDWIGSASPAIVNYGIPSVTLSRFFAHNGTSATGSYPGLDRYGRIATQRWTTAGFGPHASDPDVPNRPPLVETAYLYDNASRRTGAFDARPGSVQPLSQSYSYDGLHRLDEAIRGAWNHNLASPTVTHNRDSQDWSLDPLGNWLKVATDLDGAGGFDADETETREFLDPSLSPPTNRVNELYKRELAADAGGDTLDLTYDFAGNILRRELTDDGTDTTALRYTHDAWNRLVRVEFEDADEQIHPRGEYEYNGLNWRTITRADTSLADLTHALDQTRLMYYGPEWQLLEERIDDAYPTSPGINRHMQHVWGVRYIDDIVASRQDYDPSAADGPELVTFHLTDAQFSTVAIIGTDASILERVAYTAYGVARHQWRADINGDGAVNGLDLGLFFSAYDATIDDAGYLSEADLNLDGVIDGLDSAVVFSGNQGALPRGVLSSPLVDNHVGFDGYMFARETQSYLVRMRWYMPPLGRWVQQDPKRYIDGMSTYEYARSTPLFGADPLGTRRQVIALEGWGTSIGLSGQFVSYQSKIGQVVHDKVESRDWHYYDWTEFEAAKKTAIDILTVPDSERSQVCSVVGRFHTLALLGFSNGGDAAHDLAHDLSGLGYDVDLVATMDPVPRGVKGVVDFINVFSGPSYAKSSTTKRWINYYQRLADPKGWSVGGADIDHKFTSSGKASWSIVPGTQVLGLDDVVKGEWFSFAEHASIPRLRSVLSEWRSSVSAMAEWRHVLRRAWEGYE